MATYESSVLNSFPSGTKLAVYPRLTDRFRPGLGEVKSTTVPKDGRVKVSGLEPMGSYWLAGEVDGEWRAVAFTPKPDDLGVERFSREGALRERRLAAQANQKLRNEALTASPAPDRNTGPVVEDERETAKEEPLPYPNQLDMKKNVLQRSDTAYGEAHPKDSDEPQPKPRQDQVKKGTVQRSDTEFGEAAPKDRDEVQPFRRQEDSKGMLQRSDTPEGSVTPKPRAKSPKAGAEVTKDVESSEAKAQGRTREKPASAVTKKKSVTSPEKSTKRGAGKDVEGGTPTP